MKRAALLSLLAGLVLLALAGLAAGSPYPAVGRVATQGDGSGLQVRHPDSVMQAVKSDVSAPLRSIAPIVPVMGPAREFPIHRLDKGTGTGPGVDTSVQSYPGGLAMPTPIASFEGIYNYWGGYPPDTTGDVGPNNYVQIVNLGFQIFTKTGTSLYGPASTNTLFTGFGGVCETTNQGDTNVVYDPLADRWIMTQFAWTSGSGPTWQCFAVSTSGDPTGSYYRYQFFTGPTTFEDYPHVGVWPDAYYMTANEFGSPSGGGNFAFERDKMLVGDPNARMVYFHIADSALLPSDMDGPAPPAGSPNPFLEWADTSTLRLWRFHVDWANTANSTFTGPISLPVTAFSTVNGIPQPGTAVRLDDLSDRLMYRLAYRNLGDHDALVVNHTVSDGSGRAGIRWYEIRDPNGAPNVYQQGTYAPADGLYRWMGSAAMDRMGNIAVGYSVSSSSVYPSIRYAGRLVTDPLGELSQGEAELIAGTGSQTGSAARWGDYSDLTVDPTDDCTFWYTTEYIQTTGERTWRTRIGSFRMPNCSGNVTPTPTVTGTPPTATPTHTPTPLPSATPTLCPGGLDTVGSINNNDPTQAGRRDIRGAGSTCTIPKSCAGPLVTTPTHYDSYTLVNTSSAAQCVTVHIVPDCGNNGLFSLAYLGSFNPQSLCTNYLADAGRGGPNMLYSFNVPAGATYVVVVHEVNAGIGCNSYHITVNQCDQSLQTVTPAPPTGTPTSTPGAATETPVPPTPCTITFTDVPPENTFYPYVRCLACRGVLGGYSDGTYRPNNNITRGQIAKVVSNAAAFSDPIPSDRQTYTDVPNTNTFWEWIERLTIHGVMSGYNCGVDPNEPCDPQNRAYFRWANNATRAQLAKIDSNAAGFNDDPTTQTFADVDATHPFYVWIERLATRGIMGGYVCGGVGEPCDPQNRPYFRPYNNVTRGQAAKIVANTFYPNCQTPGRK